jgi:hypothetical protein
LVREAFVYPLATLGTSAWAVRRLKEPTSYCIADMRVHIYRDNATFRSLGAPFLRAQIYHKTSITKPRIVTSSPQLLSCPYEKSPHLLRLELGTSVNAITTSIT